MTIGEAARRSGFTIKTLRFYERRGLLRPSRSAGGYRQYADAELERLEFIRQAKTLGLTLESIREMVLLERDANGSRIAQLRTVLRERSADVAHQIETLTRLRRELEHRRRMLARRRRRGPPRSGACTCLSESRPRR